jgi:hypothetical protein
LFDRSIVVFVVVTIGAVIVASVLFRDLDGAGVDEGARLLLWLVTYGLLILPIVRSWARNGPAQLTVDVR